MTSPAARPAGLGHIGEYIACAIFGIELEASAGRAGHDGHITAGLLAGRTVDIKLYGKREGLLDINERNVPDYYLILTGPVAQDSRTDRATAATRRQTWRRLQRSTVI